MPPGPSSSSAEPLASPDPADAEVSAPADVPADVSVPSLAAPSLEALVRRLRVREDDRLAPWASGWSSPLAASGWTPWLP